MKKALTPDLLATDLAEYLVRKGVSILALYQTVDHLMYRSNANRFLSDKPITSPARASG